MASETKHEGFSVWTIRSPDGGTTASFVPELGGIGSSLVVPGPAGPREVFFQHTFFWDRDTKATRGGWPFLFPICGRLERDGQSGAYSVGGRIYLLPIHGFAPNMPWQVHEHSKEHKLTLRLVDTPETLEVYPFQFEVLLTYRMEQGAMVCEQAYTNRGKRLMPFYAGFHPYFLTPPEGAGKERVLVQYEPEKRLRYDERYVDVVGEDALPAMPVSVADPQINEMLTVMGKNHEVRAEFPDGLRLFMRAEGIEQPELFRYVQLYTKPGHPFFCAEPWMGRPNGLNVSKGAFWLAPGETLNAVVRLWTSWL